jgi:hypothetical protein
LSTDVGQGRTASWGSIGKQFFIMGNTNLKEIPLDVWGRYFMLGCAAILALLSVRGASAQHSGPTPTSKTHAAESSADRRELAQTFSSKVNDPTALLSLIQFRDVLAPSLPGTDGTANLFEIQPVLPISSSHVIPFAQLIKITFAIGSTPGPDGASGLGDLQFFDLARIGQSWGTWGVGPVLVFPTATSESLGQGKWQVGPAAAIMYTAVKHLQLGAIFQNPVSFAGDSSRESVCALYITPTLTYNFPGGWFGGYSDFDWTFDWRNDDAATIPIGVQFGKVFALGTVPFSFSLEWGYNVVRPPEIPRWLVGFELNWIISRPSKPR